jgi:putative glutamine amidotransferase
MTRKFSYFYTMFRKSVLHALLILLLIAGACSSPGTKPVILVSREYGNRFMNWLSRADNTIRRIDMYPVSSDSIDHYLALADGIIISGGPDIDPAIYGKPAETKRCGPIDHRRDSLELIMISYALEKGIPLLGICRGNQILNASMGGSLIIDIPADFDTTIEHNSQGMHWIRILEGTLLHNIVGIDSGLVNSRHHQAVERIAPGFRASALAPDGIIEAIEPAGTGGHSFVLGLQWHPESMIEDSDSPLTLPVAVRFMDEVHMYMKKTN